MIAILTAGMAALVRTLGEDGAGHALREIIERHIATPVNDMSRKISERRTVLKITSAALTAAAITPVIGDTFTAGICGPRNGRNRSRAALRASST